jgi:hypothetical protein
MVDLTASGSGKPRDDMGGRQFAAATGRNREPILAVLERILPPEGTILEIGSGTGEHAVYLAPRLPGRHWLPSDIAPDKRMSITAWINATPTDSILKPVSIDTLEHHWTVERVLPSPRITAMVSINMIHIAPWQACLGLLAGASRILQRGQVLYFYGPFMRDGKHTAPSNESFDDRLQVENPDWGIRDLEEVADAAALQGLDLAEVVEMPANNLSVIFRRA